MPMPVPAEVPEERIKIYYASTAYNDGQQFEPFKKVYDAAYHARHVRDSLFYLNDKYKTTREDSAIFMPAMNDAYQVIQLYAEKLRSGVTIEKAKAHYGATNETVGDESHNFLRESVSTLLNNADFAFLAGSPFVYEDPELYKDPGGNPEAHYLIDVPDNGQYFFNFAYSRYPGPIDLTYGPPILAYEGRTIEVNGIGSITHHLKNRIPVWFLTTIGTIQGSLIDVTMKLGEGPGCTSSYPAYTFAAPKNINPKSIFGILYCDNLLISGQAYAYSEEGGVSWTYDLNGDNQAEFIRVESLDSGASSDELAIAIWYVKLNGSWLVVDYGRQPDCT